MRRILKQRPSPAMVVAFIALSVALAGTASALPGKNRVKRDDIARNAVRTSDIASNAIRTRHIRSRQVTRSKIARRSIDSGLVANDSLVGDDILESSLKKVPDADKLDGKDLSEIATGTKIARFTLLGGQTREVFKTGPLTLTATCTISGGGDSAQILISTTQDHAAFEAFAINSDLDGGDPLAARQWVGITVPSGTPSFRSATGSAVAPDGSVINGATLFAGVNVLGLTGQCVFGGNITS